MRKGPSVSFQVFMRGWTGDWRSVCSPFLTSEGKQGTAVPSWAFPPGLVLSTNFSIGLPLYEQQLCFDKQWEVCHEKKVMKCLCKVSCDAHFKTHFFQETDVIPLTCSRSATLSLCLPGFLAFHVFINSSIKPSVRFLSSNVNAYMSGHLFRCETAVDWIRQAKRVLLKIWNISLF